MRVFVIGVLLLGGTLSLEGKVVWSVPWRDKDRDTNYLTRPGVPYSVADQ